MDYTRVVAQYMEHCWIRQLRPKTMNSCEQTLVLFGVWMREMHQVTQAEMIKEHILPYALFDLQTRESIPCALWTEQRTTCKTDMTINDVTITCINDLLKVFVPFSEEYAIRFRMTM